MSRPRSDPLEIPERIIAAVRAEPGLGVEAIRRRVKARGSDVRRVLRFLREAQGLELPSTRPGRPKKHVPNPESGSPDVDRGIR